MTSFEGCSIHPGSFKAIELPEPEREISRKSVRGTFKGLGGRRAQLLLREQLCLPCARHLDRCINTNVLLNNFKVLASHLAKVRVSCKPCTIIPHGSFPITIPHADIHRYKRVTSERVTSLYDCDIAGERAANFDDAGVSMSSSQPFVTSSPVSLSILGGKRRKSRFTFKHLAQLSLSSTSCPLRVIALLDLDAFYAQCEMVRLGVPPDQPLAVQQWQGLIAINYPARAYGLNRHVTVAEAQKACPHVIIQHVATWKEGEDKWAYHEDAFKNMGTHKVSLDPYRLQSRRIIALIKETLPTPPVQKVEKASVDEVFMDLSTQVHGTMLERYPELRGPPPYDDPTENLPLPPTTSLDWNADALVDLDAQEAEEDAPDWDDIAMLIGSEIVHSVRAKILERLKYTCSAGLARNKMLAKLGAGHKKPNNQTVVRNRAIQHFLSSFKFTKIRNLGGKLGDQVVSTFNTETVSELLAVPLETLKQKIGDDTGNWLWHTIRGEDMSEVNSRTQIKSMLSAKSFRPSINSFEQAVRWLRIFVADIFSRLVEDGVLENKRRPRTINLHHRQGAQTRSKQAPIPQGKSVDEESLFSLAKDLMAQVIVDGRAWPCANLSLSVGGFEDGPTGNQGIGGFLVKGEEAKMLQENKSLTESNDGLDGTGSRPNKRRRVDEKGRINQFFSMTSKPPPEPVDFEDLPSAQQEREPTSHDFDGGVVDEDHVEESDNNTDPGAARASFPIPSSSSPPPAEPVVFDGGATVVERAKSPPRENQDIRKYFCTRCQKSCPLDQEEEHQDWHFARDLQSQEQPRPASSKAGSQKLATQARPPAKPTRGRGRPPGGGGQRGSLGSSMGGVEKGQSRLAFGR